MHSSVIVRCYKYYKYICVSFIRHTWRYSIFLHIVQLISTCVVELTNVGEKIKDHVYSLLSYILLKPLHQNVLRKNNSSVWWHPRLPIVDWIDKCWPTSVFTSCHGMHHWRVKYLDKYMSFFIISNPNCYVGMIHKRMAIGIKISINPVKCIPFRYAVDLHCKITFA